MDLLLDSPIDRSDGENRWTDRMDRSMDKSSGHIEGIYVFKAMSHTKIELSQFLTQ